MRRIQIHTDEELDIAVASEAARRGDRRRRPSARAASARVGVPAPAPDPRDAVIGWLDHEPVEGIDDVTTDPREPMVQ